MEVPVAKYQVTSPSLPSSMGPPRWEWAALFLLLGGFLGFNLYTYNDYPNVWCDEVWFSEPAVNLIQHGNFTTTTWQFQPANTFPTVNCPLYSMTLVPWLKLTGTSLLSVRSLNYSLMAVAGFLVWLISWRFDLVKTSALRLFMVAILHLGYGISFAYRCSRPDILGLICLALLALCFQFRARTKRDCYLFVLSAMTVWIGLQVSLFAWFAAATAWLFLRRNLFRELIVLSVGMACGLLSVLLFFASHGVLSYFLPMVVGWLGKRYAHAPQLPLSTRLFTVLRDSLASSVDDFTTLVLILGLVIVLALSWKRLRVRFLGWMIFLILATPLLFNLVGHYAFYYSYARFVPATLAFFAGWSALGHDIIQPFPAIRLHLLRLTCIATIVAAALVGLPMRIFVTLASSQLKPRSELQRFVNSSVRSDDVAFVDDALFFEVKSTASIVYGKNYSSSFLQLHIQGHDFNPEEKRSINVLVIRPEQAEFATNFFGGMWQLESGPFGDTQDFSRLAGLPLIGPRLVHYGTQPQTQRYSLQIFRRVVP
jgi:hypothetical protein